MAEPRFDISSRLNGYDLVQAVGSSSKETDLPPITVASGSEGLIQLAREFRYPKEYNRKGRITVTRTAYLGIRMPIYFRQTEDGNLTFLLRAELCERLDVNDPSSPVSKTTSSIQGVASPGKMRTIIIGAPGGKQATLQITFTPR
ncbi:MAG: hypothetical protein ACJ8M4_09205 [Chthoniobacterales bacterium]